MACFSSKQLTSASAYNCSVPRAVASLYACVAISSSASVQAVPHAESSLHGFHAPPHLPQSQDPFASRKQVLQCAINDYLAYLGLACRTRQTEATILTALPWHQRKQAVGQGKFRLNSTYSNLDFEPQHVHPAYGLKSSQTPFQQCTL